MYSLFFLSLRSCFEFFSKHFFLSFNLYLSWRIIALQCCVGFCHTAVWISPEYKCIPSLLHLPPPHPHPTPRGPHGALSWAPCSSSFPLAVCFTHGKVYISVLLLTLSFHPLLPLLCPQVHSLHLRLYICVSIWYLFFSFWLSSLCITGSRFVHLNSTDSNSFLSVANIPLCIRPIWICSLSIHVLMDI